MNRIKTMYTIHSVLLVFAICLIAFLSMFCFIPKVEAAPAQIVSQDGQYEAVLVGEYPDVHYEVRNRSNGQSLFKTRAKYSTPNDVKSGIFLFNSRLFAVAYHYGHEGKNTWIGIWDMARRYRVQGRKKTGWIRDLSFLSEDQNLKRFYGNNQTNFKVFYFKVNCPSSVTPCYTTAVQAINSESAKAMAQQSASTCKVESITSQQYSDSCQ